MFGYLWGIRRSTIVVLSCVGDFAPQRTHSNIRRQFWMSKLDGAATGRCCGTPHDAQGRPHNNNSPGPKRQQSPVQETLAWKYYMYLWDLPPQRYFWIFQDEEPCLQ